MLNYANLCENVVDNHMYMYYVKKLLLNAEIGLVQFYLAEVITKCTNVNYQSATYYYGNFVAINLLL